MQGWEQTAVCWTLWTTVWTNWVHKVQHRQIKVLTHKGENINKVLRAKPS